MMNTDRARSDASPDSFYTKVPGHLHEDLIENMQDMQEDISWLHLWSNLSCKRGSGRWRCVKRTSCRTRPLTHGFCRWMILLQRELSWFLLTGGSRFHNCVFRFRLARCGRTICCQSRQASAPLYSRKDSQGWTIACHSRACCKGCFR